MRFREKRQNKNKDKKKKIKQKNGREGRRNTYRATSCQSFTILLPGGRTTSFDRLFSRWNPEKKWKDRASVRKYNRLLDCSNVYSSIIWKSSGSKYNISNWWKVIFVIFISFYDLSLFCCERMMRYRYKNCEILK